MNIRWLYHPTVFFTIFLLFSCHGKEQTDQRSTKISSFKIDITDPESTFLKIKDAGPFAIDSFYTSLLSSLSDSEKYPLLQQHIYCYERIDGGRKEAKALIAKAQGITFNYFSKYDSSKICFDQAVILYTELNRPKDLAEVYVGQSVNYAYKGDNAQALICNYKALDIYEQLHDSDHIYRVKTEIGIDLRHQREYYKALEIVLQCRDYFQRHGNLLMVSYVESIISNIYSCLADDKKSLEHILLALSITRQIGSKGGIAECLNNAAGCYVVAGDWDKAEQYYTEAIGLERELNDQRQIIIMKANLAKCALQKGDKQKGQQMVNEVIAEAHVKGERNTLLLCYRFLTTFYEGEKEYQKALAYYRKYKQLNDTIFDYEKEKIINDLNIKYETKERKEKITKLNSEKKTDQVKKMAYLLILFFTTVIATLTILFLSNRNKKNKLTLQMANLELAANANELRHFTESILRKNKSIDELETRLQDIAINTELAIITEQNNEQLSQLYQLKILTEDDWRQFKILFDKVYPGYINNLRDRYPELTPAEQRQFLLIKLKIDSKECADMLGISVVSVKKNRYRLKKRFNLSETDNLDEFVWSFV